MVQKVVRKSTFTESFTRTVGKFDSLSVAKKSDYERTVQLSDTVTERDSVRKPARAS